MSNVEKLVEEISKLNMIEVHDLVKMLETKWGISAKNFQQSISHTVNTNTNLSDHDTKKSEKKEFDIFLEKVGEKKIEAIKIVRTITNLGLKAAKDLVDSAPVKLKDKIKLQEAQEIQSKFKAIGAIVELK